jgi:hypothetical protein
MVQQPAGARPRRGWNFFQQACHRRLVHRTRCAIYESGTADFSKIVCFALTGRRTYAWRQIPRSLPWPPVEKGDSPCRQYRFAAENLLFGKGQSPFSTGCWAEIFRPFRPDGWRVCNDESIGRGPCHRACHSVLPVRLKGGKISAQGNALGSWFPTTVVALSGRNNNPDTNPTQDVTGAGGIIDSLARQKPSAKMICGTS